MGARRLVQERCPRPRRRLGERRTRETQRGTPDQTGAGACRRRRRRVPEPAVGVRVMAPWKNRHMYPGRVGAVSKSKDEVKINFGDGDELVVPWAACRLRDAPRPTFF